MRTPINLVLGSLCALALVAPADEPEAAAETASEILLPFKKSLKQALVKGMESGPMVRSSYHAREQSDSFEGEPSSGAGESSPYKSAG